MTVYTTGTRGDQLSQRIEALFKKLRNLDSKSLPAQMLRKNISDLLVQRSKLSIGEANEFLELKR